MGRRIEIFSTGIDEFLQGLGGDPWALPVADGLRIPTLPTVQPPNGAPANRYLFNLCSFTLPPNCIARIRGYRQLLTLGFKQGVPAPRFVEQEVVTPTFRLADGNVSWHLVQFTPGSVPNQGAAGPTDLRNFAFQMSDTPALLYSTATGDGSPFYPGLLAYVPPNQGRPWGEAVREGLGTFYTLHSRWLSDHAWNSLDIPIVGPTVVSFQASVKQSNPETRVALTAPAGGGAFTFSNGLSPEEQFLQNFPGAIYWRIGGALVMELEFYGDIPTSRIDCSGTPNQEAIR
jgi:hypothetical protein